MINRRRLLVAGSLTTLAPPVFAAVAPDRRPWRIYAITFRGMTDVEKGFQDHFAARGIAVEIAWRDAAREPARIPGFIAEIRQTRPDLVYTWGTSVTLGVVGAHDAVDPVRHITEIPVVFTLVAAPVLAKIVPSLQSSGRNVTGVFHVASTASQVRAIVAYRPFRSLGVLYTPSEPNSIVTLKELEDVGARQGFRVVARPFRRDASGRVTGDGAAELVAELVREQAEWLYLPPDSFLGTLARETVIPAATALGLPTFASTEQLMESGALAGLVSRYHSIGEFTAYKAEQILLRRLLPAAVPIETLKRFSFQINLPVARSLRLLPPLHLFNYAGIVTD